MAKENDNTKTINTKNAIENLTVDDCNNILIFLDRVEFKGLKEVQIVMALIRKLSVIAEQNK